MSVLGVALLGIGGYGLWKQYSIPEPPLVELQDIDPEIVAAVEAARTGVMKMPAASSAWSRLGAVFRAHGFPAESNVCFAQAEQLDSQNPRWPYLIAVEMLTHDPNSALPKLRRAVDLSPDDIVPQMRLAEVLYERGEWDESESLLKAALSLSSEYGPESERPMHQARVQFWLGQIALARDEPPRAREHLLIAVAAAPSVKAVRLALAQSQRLCGDEAAARETLNSVAELPEGRPWLDPWLREVDKCAVGLRPRLDRVAELDRLKMREEAVVEARAAVRRYPASARAWLVLGEMLNHENNFKAADPALHEAIRLNPESAIAHFQLGVALQNLKRRPAAVESYRKALTLQPEHAPTHYNLGLTLLSLEEKEGALEEFRAAVHIRPGSFPALLAQAALLAQLERYEEALPIAEDAARAAPLADKRPDQLIGKIRKLMAERDKLLTTPATPDSPDLPDPPDR
jgi:tetratricopeptide (TPR) repeat protein